MQLLARLSRTQIVLEGFALCASSVNEDARTHTLTHTCCQGFCKFLHASLCFTHNQIVATRNLTCWFKCAGQVCPRAREVQLLQPWRPSAFSHDCNQRTPPSQSCCSFFLHLCLCVAAALPFGGASGPRPSGSLVPMWPISKQTQADSIVRTEALANADEKREKHEKMQAREAEM